MIHLRDVESKLRNLPIHPSELEYLKEGGKLFTQTPHQLPLMRKIIIKLVMVVIAKN
jgi:hypothetical protein